MREPKRLLETEGLAPNERLLLEAGRIHRPVHFDVARGAARFNAQLEASTGIHAAAKTALELGKLAKLGLLLVPAVSFVIAYSVSRTNEPAVEPAAQGSRAAVALQAERAVAQEERVVVDRGITHPQGAIGGAVEPTRPRASAGGPRTIAPRPLSPTGRKRGPAAATSLAKASAHAAAMSATASSSPRAGGVGSDSEVGSQPVEQAPQLSAAEAHAPNRDDASIDELHAIARARLLVMRDPKAALELLDRVARAHPNGYFIEEREALRVLALAALAGDRDQAERRAKAFLRAYPDSPFADRVRAATNR